MLWTLQKYIFREMGKAFVLTSVGMIGVLALGGGVMNMIELEGVTASQLLQILALVVPLATAISMPFAALFAATVTYGRMSADNEFVACRSSGINIHKLFLPTVVVSLISAVCSFVLINFVIPGMIRNIDRFFRADIPRIVRHQLSTPRRLAINRDKYRVYAGNSDLVPPEPGADPDALPELRLGGVAFVEMDGSKWARYGTAQQISIGFDARDEQVYVAAEMHGLSVFDSKQARWLQSQYEAIDRYPMPQKIPVKTKWMDLGELLQYRRQPSLFPEVRRRLAAVRASIASTLYYQDILQQYSATGEVRLGDDKVAYVIRPGGIRSEGEDNRPVLVDGVTILERRANLQRTVRATEAVIAVEERRRGDQVDGWLQAEGDVAVEDSRQPGIVLRRNREKFDPVAVPESILRQAQAFSDARLLNPDTSLLEYGPTVEKRRTDAAEKVSELIRDIAGEVHARGTFSISVFVLVLLGAALGIIFRGSHALTAFGISFVPSLFVITMIIMGKQLADRPHLLDVGLALMWTGIGVVAVVDFVVMTKVLRR